MVRDSRGPQVVSRRGDRRGRARRAERDEAADPTAKAGQEPVQVVGQFRAVLSRVLLCSERAERQPKNCARMTGHGGIGRNGLSWRVRPQLKKRAGERTMSTLRKHALFPVLLIAFATVQAFGQ